MERRPWTYPLLDRPEHLPGLGGTFQTDLDHIIQFYLRQARVLNGMPVLFQEALQTFNPGGLGRFKG